MDFHKKRRQQFLTEAAYRSEGDFFREHAAPSYLEAFSRPDFDANDRRRNANAYADGSFVTYMIRYTAGESLSSLREDLDHVVFAYEQATMYVRAYENDPAFPVLRFIEIDEYERVLQLIGLCFLLHRRDLLPRVAAMFDPASAGLDTLYEDILSFEMEGRFEIDKWYHETYRDLINTMYRDSDQETIQDFENYLKKWYKSLSRAPWHDSHLAIEGDNSAGYFGYWAVEAAALAYLMDVDDKSFREHMVYPKDMVDFAKRMDQSPSSLSDTDGARISRVPGGNRCPTSGFWMTPAQLNSRKLFEAGEIMPIYSKSTYGATIWQWSQDQ